MDSLEDPILIDSEDEGSLALDPPLSDIPDRIRGLWEALSYLETEAQRVGGAEVGILLGCARMALERRWGGSPPPEPGRAQGLH